MRELLTALAAAQQVADVVPDIRRLCIGLCGADAIALRLFDVRSDRQVRWVAVLGALRADVPTRRLALERDAFAHAEISEVWRVTSSVIEVPHWESPFDGTTSGLTLILGAAGELCGALDVGFVQHPGEAALAAMRTQLAPLAAALAIGLRAERLRRDLAGARDYQAQLIDSANAFILGIERGWQVHVANTALLSALGLARGDLLGRDVRDFLPVADRPRLVELLGAAFAGHARTGVAVTLLPRHGAKLDTVWNFAPISAVGDDVRSVVAIGQDISQLASIKERLVRQERLATIGQLTAGVVHELNNPLTSITVYAAHVRKQAERFLALGEADVDKLRRVEESAQRILRLCRDLVEFSRPLPKNFEVTDLRACVGKALSYCEHELAQHQASLRFDDGGQPAYADVVAPQVEQVVINLVSNALGAMAGLEARHRVLHVRVLRRQDEVGILVADAGPGIAGVDVARLFEPFFTTKRAGEGTGLGLSIVKNIVDSHRGRIDVRDSDLGGAAFVVWLPAVLPQPGPA